MSNQNEKQKKASQKESENEAPQKRRRRSVEEPVPFYVTKFQCCWHTQYDDEANFRAAGQRQTKTKLNSEHMKTITEQSKKWLQLSNTNISCIR